MIITSVKNELVKETAKLHQRKFRDETDLFLLEGDKCIEEAISSGIELVRVFVEEGYEKFRNLDIITTTKTVLSKISTTETAPRTVAVAKKLQQKWNKNFKKVILLENIKDAGNLGTIIRTSCAFNVDAIILYGDTVDLYNPKTVRSAVGNLWKVPVFSIKSLNELKELCKEYTPIATLPKDDNTIPLRDFKTSGKTLVMFGTEADGLSNELIKYALNNGQAVTIEMSDKVESLNLSISAGVIMYQAFITN